MRYLVATGDPSHHGKKTEIVDILDPTKSCLLDDTAYRGESTGGLLGTTPVICGGRIGPSKLNKCILYGTTQVITMNSKRAQHLSITLNSSMLWIMGGSNANDVTTEFITKDAGAVNGPTLPEPVGESCAVRFIKNGYIYLIGGMGGSDSLYEIDNVWVANPLNDFAFTEGPSLMTARFEHSCSTMSIGAKSIIVAAGGFNSNSGELKSVEILDPTSNQWVAGK